MTPSACTVLSNDAGLRFEFMAHGAPGRCVGHGVALNAFAASALEAGGTQLWLRLHAANPAPDTAPGTAPGTALDAAPTVVPLLGPLSPLAPQGDGPASAGEWSAVGSWQGLRLLLQCRLAPDAPAWFWHLHVVNASGVARRLDLIGVQDLALAAYGATRLNEYYVSHYLDLSPLAHAQHGPVVAARQNLAVDGRHPWLVMGSLRRAVSFATDALQVQGLGVRAGVLPQGIVHGLPGRRLQHEHAVIALQDEALTLAPNESASLGFFGHWLADHPLATSDADLAHVDTALALPQARPQAVWPVVDAAGVMPPPSLFATAPWLTTQDLSDGELAHLFPGPQRHVEHDDGARLSFFHAEHTHVVLRAKELRTMRPHGHLLRSGEHLVPDEGALTSTAWMGGVFHSMLTQGHVSINRCLSTVRSWLGLYRAHGQRVFVDCGAGWQQLGLPSAFAIEPEACRWLYRHAGGLIELTSRAHAAPHAMSLNLRVLQGGPLRVLVTHHVALGGDDGIDAAPLPLRAEGDGLFVGVPAGSELAARFPHGGFVIAPEPGSAFEARGGDDLLCADGVARGQPFVCVRSAPVMSFGLRLLGRLVDAEPAPHADAPLPQWTVPSASTLAPAAERLAEIAPWYRHNALIHYLSPRGLEQFSGGGWGTRDVCQGPLEMLLALDRPAPVRELLLRVFAAQDAGGDWPQWFMFFARERHIRAGDSHGDIVFWPLLGLARYLLASGDAALLDEPVAFHAAPGETAEIGTVWQHVERALRVIAARRIAGTHLAAYGHGDWNDSLQPANPALREHLCSAWTVTLHRQMLTTLARALSGLGQAARAQPLQTQAAAVAADFQRLLVVDDVVTGYALFDAPAAATPPPQLLLHPQDRLTGVRYSLLPMMHAILEDLLSPAQAQAQRRLIDEHLSGPDGARLFDRPLPYRGGPETLFQRAESSAFFGREIGVMYMHAHLRWAETLAHLGDADALFAALARAHPIALRECVPSASLRQANCYFSSSDAAFADRYEAGRDYARVARGEVALDGGWRVYSSGPGIALALIVGRFLGVRREHDRLLLDPVIPQALDGLVARLTVGGLALEIEYRLGPLGRAPHTLTLGDAPLPFTREPNPYRIGAAAVAMADLLPRLLAGAPRLVVHTD